MMKQHVYSDQLHIGTSGWTYQDWKGRFYPQSLKAHELWAFYKQQFDSVEINASFYRLPNQKVIDAWNSKIPSDYHLVVKASRVITHMKKLKDCQVLLQKFLEQVLQLKGLKIILWQLPPQLHKDIARLEQFLKKLPCLVRHAVEFRHQSWWDQEVADLLGYYRATFVALSHPVLPDTIYPKTDFIYLRFHGLGEQLYQHDYQDPELVKWANRIKSHLAVGRQVYAFFNNDYQAHAPYNALRLKLLLEG